MKVLFLDHQGVLYLKRHPCPGQLQDFDSACVTALNQILTTVPDLQIVISSDWKYWVPLSEMQAFYRRQGILRAPIDFTPRTARYDIRQLQNQRATEISAWLDANPVKAWAAVDDLDMRPYLKNFVWVSQPLLGLRLPEICKQIQDMFS